MNELLKKLAGENNWTLADQLEICLEYISNQNNDPTFEEYLKETAASKRYHADAIFVNRMLGLPRD